MMDEKVEINRWGRFGLTVLRLVLGAMFVFSGTAHLGFLAAVKDWPLIGPLAQYGVTPLRFAGSIRAYHIFDPQLIPFATYAIPWLELISGMALIIGLFTRGAGWLINFLLAMFILGMFSVMIRHIDTDCSCFGSLLGTKVGWLSVGRDVIMMIMAGALIRWGGGFLSVDSLCRRCESQA